MFAFIWQSIKWLGIIAIKTARTHTHFLSDVLVAVASLDLKSLTSWLLKEGENSSTYDLSGQGRELYSTANDPQNGPQMILDLKWSRYCTEPTTNLDRFVTKNCKRLVYDIRKLKQRRRRRQRERQKSNWFRLAKQQLCTCIMLFCTFLCRQCTTTTWIA